MKYRRQIVGFLAATAGVLAMAILFGWQKVMEHYYPGMNKPPVPAAGAPAAGAAPAPQASASGKPTREGGLTDDADKALEAKDLATALNPATRVPIAAPGLSGSIRPRASSVIAIWRSNSKSSATLSPRTIDPACSARAKSIATCTSATDRQRAMAAGRLSIMALYTARAWS